MTKTFAERCHIAQQFLPDAQYKAMLTALHTEMLAALAEQPAPEIAIADAFRAGVDSGIDAEREACAKVCVQVDEEGECPDQWDWHSSDYAAAIRARAKLAEQPAQQEPVAWMYQHPNNHLKTCYQAYKPNGECTPLYTNPQAPKENT